MSRRTLLITGVTKGIGRGLADAALDEGHIVLGCGRNEGALAELRGRATDDDDFSKIDVTDDAAVAAWAKRLVASGRVPDLVFNNAALINDRAPLWEVSAEEFGAMMDVNLKGVASIVRHFAPPMIERGSGVFVHLSSGWGRGTSPDVAPYCATKFGIEGLSGALAQELPSGLASIALSPGVVHTEMLQVAFGKSGAASAIEPDQWGRIALPELLSYGPAQNGASLTIAG